MEAIILAAGLGTRLRPLTDEVPKALIEVGGLPMLEHVARRLVEVGVDRIVVNTHHLGDRIEEYVRQRAGFGVDVRIAPELGPAPLDTGGGIKQAATRLRLEAPVLVHNVDVISDLSLSALLAAHDGDVIATLVVKDVPTRSPLLVDRLGLVGVRYPSGEERRAREPVGPVSELAFCGVSVIAPELPSLMTETGAFPAIPFYLRLIREGHRFAVHPIDDAVWIDIGTHERLEEARRTFGGGG